MEASGCYLTIESVKKVSSVSFSQFMEKQLMAFIEENDGDFTKLETDGAEHILYLVSCYEEGERA